MLTKWSGLKTAKEILDTYRVDQERAYELLFESYFERLLLFSNRIVCDPEAAKDIVQECFVRFWQYKRIAKVEEQMESYLFQAVRFESFNYLRNIKRRTGHLERIAKESSVVDRERYEEDVDHFESLYRTIDRLPNERKKIFLMICVDGMKYQEVADQLQISKNSVKTQMSRALKFLREELTLDTFSILLYILRKK